MTIKFHLAQLRHLYSHMINGKIVDQQEAAKGLLGPAIECIEKHLEKPEK